MSEENKRVVRRLIEEHYNRKNAALVSELFSSAVSLHTPDGVLTGLEGASGLLQGYATAFPDFRLTIDDLIAEGDRVVMRYAFTGTNLGRFGDVPATGKHVSVANAIGIYRLISGKVIEGHLSWDKYSLLQQLGVLATDPAAANT